MWKHGNNNLQSSEDVYKVSARWVPRNLTANDWAHCTTTSQELVDLFTSDPDKFMHQIVTGDETWVHHWDPESKQQAMQRRCFIKEIQIASICPKYYGDGILRQ